MQQAVVAELLRASQSDLSIPFDSTVEGSNLGVLYHDLIWIFQFSITSQCACAWTWMILQGRIFQGRVTKLNFLGAIKVDTLGGRGSLWSGGGWAFIALCSLSHSLHGASCTHTHLPAKEKEPNQSMYERDTQLYKAGILIQTWNGTTWRLQKKVA